MPERIIPFIDVLITGLMTLFSYLTGFFSILLISSWTSFFGLVPTLLATLYWLPKLKKQIKTNHNGKILDWLKSFIKKK